VLTWLRNTLDRVLRRRGSGAGYSSRSLLSHYRHDYDAPADILRRLRETDPTADLLYLGWGKWLLVSVRPNSAMMATGRRRLAAAARLLQRWDTDPKLKQNPGAFRRLYQRWLYWLAVSQGARPICDYERKFVKRYGLEAIVQDFRCMDWMHRTARENDVFDDNNAQFGLGYEREKARREAGDELRSEYRHMDAWRYLAVQSHGVTRHDDPEKPRHRSGFTTVARITADGQLRRSS
jgi:hypothetical protein